MARPRDPLGPLMLLNVGHLPQVVLQRLANRMRAAGVTPAALAEATTVDPETGVVTRMLTLCQACTGACCSSLRIPITREDARRLARHLRTTVRGLGLVPPQGTDDEQDDLAGYLTLGDRPCRFFDRGCTVHVARPVVCRTFGLHACMREETFVPLVQLRRPARSPGAPA